MKSGNLNFLEPSGLLRACKGIDLPLPLPLLYVINASHPKHLGGENKEKGICAEKR